MICSSNPITNVWGYQAPLCYSIYICHQFPEQPLDKLIFEVPGPWISNIRRCDQHAMRAWLIQRFGSEVNLGNVPLEDILEVETMRRGVGVAALR